MPHKTQSYSEVRGLSRQASRRGSAQEVPELPPVPCRRARSAFQNRQVDFFIDQKNNLLTVTNGWNIHDTTEKKVRFDLPYRFARSIKKQTN